MHELPTALEDISRRFCGIEAHFTILAEPGDEAANEDMWTSSMENKTTERISVNINLAVKHKLRRQSMLSCLYGVKLRYIDSFLALSQNFLTFVRRLSAVDSNNYQLQLLEPSAVFQQEIMKHSSYSAWRDFHPKAPNVLYMYGFHDYGNARAASSLFFQFQKSSARPAVATFSFSKRDYRT